MKTNLFKSNKSFLVLCFLSLSLLVSCDKKGSPEDVAEKFLNHVNKGEFAEAKKYCDEQTASMIGMLESMSGGKENEMKNSDVKAIITSSEIKDDKATVKYKTTDGKAETTNAEQTLQLVKVDDEWKVTINKENSQKEEGMKAPADEEDMDSLEVETDSIMAE